MRKKIIKFVSKLEGKQILAFYIVIFSICIIAISLGIYSQFFYKYSKTDPLMIGINIGGKKTSEEYAQLKNAFTTLFNNDLKGDLKSIDFSRLKKKEYKNPIVYTAYSLVNYDEAYYDVNAQIPILNINSKVADEINAQIKDEFYNKVNSVMRQTEKKIVYNVSYASFINSDVVSIVIKASLKESDKSEKVIVKTYNYSVSGEKLLSLEDLILLKKTTKEVVQNSIIDEITKVSQNLEIIADEYGTVYERNAESEIYKVENSNNYFLTDDGYVYVVYAYGNEEYTNEMDIVIF